MPLPAPITWIDGEEPQNIPSADDLNLEWKDSFNFLLGVTRPIGFFRGNANQALSSTFTTMNLPDEVLKRGGLVHSTSSNTHLVTVPYTGQYQGYAAGNFDTISASGLRLTIRLLRNSSTEIARFNGSNATTGNWTINGSFTADLTANDTISMQMALSSGTANSGSLISRYPRLVIWYGGDYA